MLLKNVIKKYIFRKTFHHISGQSYVKIINIMNIKRKEKDRLRRRKLTWWKRQM